MNFQTQDDIHNLFNGKDWFYDFIYDEKSNRWIFYVNYMSLEILKEIPQIIDNKQVLVHFAASLSSTKEQYGIEAPNAYDLQSLKKELLELRKICGEYTLQSIFYEVHDSEDAITNCSIKFPIIRSAMEKLYNSYGFDLIYEEIGE